MPHSLSHTAVEVGSAVLFMAVAGLLVSVVLQISDKGLDGFVNEVMG